MGLYDYITHEGRRYQTKDTPDQYLSEYRIADGRLLAEEWHYEEVPLSERPYPDAKDWKRLIGGHIRVIDRNDIDLNWHGYIDMVEDQAPYRDYRAKFTDGNLVEFFDAGSSNQEEVNP